ncbi:MAG: hypothetical protein WCP98_06905 [Actinomycetes bacterium]
MDSVTANDDTCAVCGGVTSFGHVIATNSLPMTHLDGRLPAMQPGYMNRWLYKCPQCGYCAPSITLVRAGAAEVVHSEEYKQQLDDPDLPLIPRAYLCWALIVEAAAAGPASRGVVEARLHAAWACDNGEDVDAAVVAHHRLRAASALEALHESGGTYRPHDYSGDCGLLADLYRRAGRFEEAAAAARAGLPCAANVFARRLLELQLRLVAAGDVAEHLLCEVTAEDAEDVRFIGKWVFYEALGRLRQNPDGIWFKDLVDDMLDANAALDPRTLVGFLARAFEDDSRIVRGPFRGVFGHVPLRDATAPHPRATEWTEAPPRTNVVRDRYRGTTAYVRVLRELVRTAEQGHTTGFGDLAVIMGVGPVGASTGREVSQVLTEICEDEVNRGRPMLGAVVVGSKGRPSARLFTLARALGLPAFREDEAHFWAHERESVYEAWRRPLSKSQPAQRQEANTGGR